jgi:hypothetical protein
MDLGWQTQNERVMGDLKRWVARADSSREDSGDTCQLSRPSRAERFRPLR